MIELTVEEIVAEAERVMARGYGHFPWFPYHELRILIASWRERGEANAKMVAALKEARDFAEGDAEPKRRAIIIAKIDAALKKAGLVSAAKASIDAITATAYDKAIAAAAYDKAIAPAYGHKWAQLEERVRRNYVEVVRAVLAREW